MNAPLSLLGLILKSRVIARPTRYFAPRGDCFPAADSIDPSEAGISLAGRGAGYKTRLHRHQALDTRARPGHCSSLPWSLVTLQMVSALVALLQSPGPRCLSHSSVFTPVRGGLSPALLLSRRCTLLNFTRGSHPLHGNNGATTRRCNSQQNV